MQGGRRALQKDNDARARRSINHEDAIITQSSESLTSFAFFERISIATSEAFLPHVQKTMAIHMLYRVCDEKCPRNIKFLVIKSGAGYAVG